MPRIAGKNKLVMIALCCKHSCHVFIGNHPIMHIVTHHVWIIKVAVAHFHPNAYRLYGTLRNKMFMKFPCSMWCGGVGGPLLVDVSTRISKHTMIPFRMVPCHYQRAGTTRTAADRSAAFRVFR